MRFLISSVGSHGDTLPFISLGAELQGRGHDVRLYGNAHFEALATEAGLVFVPTSDAASMRASLADERMTRSETGLKAMAGLLMSRVESTYAAMSRDVVPEGTAVIASTLAFAPRLLAETHRLPSAVVHLAPSVLRSDHLAPRLTPLGHFEHWPEGFKRRMWKFMDRRLLDPAFTEPLNKIRERLKVPPVQRVFHRWMHQATLTVGLFPDWFSARQPDWPSRMLLAGFPGRSSASSPALSPEVNAFLENGEPPIVFTAGTANTRSRRFYDESVEACQRSGRRGILVAQERHQVADDLSDSVLHTHWASFDALLPRAAAVVHHGGIGTTAAALRSGIPHLIRPMGFDQFDNASRARRLGVARELLPRAYSARKVARVLAECLSDAAMLTACRARADMMLNEDGLGVACNAIESALKRDTRDAG